MLGLRNAEKSDVDLIYALANEPMTRANSFTSNKIDYDDHCKWFNKQLQSNNNIMFIAEDANDIIGMVRFNKKEKGWIIGININKVHRGKGYASKLLNASCRQFFILHPEDVIWALIKVTNKPSKKAFEKAGFIYDSTLKVNDIESYQYKITKNEFY